MKPLEVARSQSRYAVDYWNFILAHLLPAATDDGQVGCKRCELGGLL